MVRRDHERFAELTFDDFRRMATDDTLSQYEKVGFPDEYRAGLEGVIFEDVVAKLVVLLDRCPDLVPAMHDSCMIPSPQDLTDLFQRCARLLSHQVHRDLARDDDRLVSAVAGDLLVGYPEVLRQTVND